MLATLIRMELAYPGVSIFMGDGIKYLMISTLHGIIMVFFMIIPLIFGAYGNYLLPLQLGVHDVAFPRMNSAAFWFLPAGLIMLCQLLSLDKRYHTVNCFSFNRIDSYLNFNDIKTNYSSQLIISNDITNKTKLNYNLFSTKSNLQSNFYLAHKYNLLNKNYNLNYIYKSPYVTFLYNNIINFINLTTMYINALKYNIIILPKEYNYLNIISLLYNLNIFTYYFNNSLFINNKTIILFNNIGLYNIIIIFLDKINFIYNLNIIKYFIISEYTISNNRKKYQYFQSNFNHQNITQYEYNTQFFFKQRNPLIIQNKLININVVPAIFNTQLLQNFNKMYDKYCLNLQVNDHIKFMHTKINVLLHSNFLKNLFTPIKYNVLINNNNTYLYKYNIRLHDDILFTIFDKHIIWDSNILTHSNKLSANINMFIYNNIFINQHNLAAIFKTNTININKYNQIFSKWKHLRFQREFWRCRSMLSKNTSNNYKYHPEWSFLFDLNNKYSVLSDSADVLPGWAFVTPFSARIKYTRPGKTDIALFAVAISSFGSFVGSLNFLITYRYLSTLNNKKNARRSLFFFWRIAGWIWYDGCR